jgi:hypothetical protein
MTQIFHPESAFNHIYQKLKQIKDTKTFAEAQELIKKTTSLLDKAQIEECFSVTYVKKVSSYDHFLQALEIKARNAAGIVPTIDSCAFKYKLPMGFIRAIKIGDHEASQEVWECKKEKSYQVLYNSEGIYFTCTNELDREGDGGIFTARYCIYKHPKYKSATWFLKEVMDPTFKNLVQLSLDKNLNEKHKKALAFQ